jgi:hypothetical protein
MNRDRRALLQWLSATGALSALGALDADALQALGAQVHATPAGQPLRFLTEAEAALVRDAAERILPRTDTPGATDANVTAFIDVMLADWYPGNEAARFREGLPALDAAARTAHGRAFSACTATQQTAIVAAIDDDVTALRRTNAAQANAHWFGLLKYLTIYGYCTSEPGMTQLLRSWPLPGRYDGHAPVAR